MITTQLTETQERKTKKRAKRNIELSLRYLEKGYEDPLLSDDDLIDELLCEIDLYRDCHNNQEIQNYIERINALEEGGNIRRDLAGRFNELGNEKKVRDRLANFLRAVRTESNNGLKELNFVGRYNRLCEWESWIGELLGINNIYFSRRIDKKECLIPLRKDITRYIFKIYLKNIDQEVFAGGKESKFTSLM